MGNPPPPLPGEVSEWYSYSAVLDPSLWDGDDGTLKYVLGNVTQVSVVLESNNAIIEEIGFDNFTIATVPIPTTMLLLGTGIAGLEGTRLRRRKR